MSRSSLAPPSPLGPSRQAARCPRCCLYPPRPRQGYRHVRRQAPDAALRLQADPADRGEEALGAEGGTGNESLRGRNGRKERTKG
eukprot:765865-Hanusia_phi.AAC.3